MTGNINLEPLIRFMKTLPKSGDIELTLLKCHLLIDEVLTKMIELNHKHPKYLNEARLAFSQKMKLARASNDIQHQAWVWKSLHLLNQARNELAHNLTAEQIEAKLEVFTVFVKGNEVEWPTEAISGKFTEFHWAVYLVYTVVSAATEYDPKTVKVSTILTQ